VIIGIIKLLILISSSSSLKEKRMVLRSLKDKLKNNFNISIIELNDHDKWQKATLALATIGVDESRVNPLMSNIINYFENNKQVQLINYETEII
jgi:uncharacterized protein YlxP (DUF503 family)